MALSEKKTVVDSTVLGSGFSLWQVTNAWQRAVRAALTPAGLTYVQLMLLAGLEELLETRATVKQAELAESLGADKMMTSQVLRALENEDLVVRRLSIEDTRVRQLEITPLGRDRMRQALPLLAEAERRFFQALGTKEDRFLKALQKLSGRKTPVRKS